MKTVELWSGTESFSKVARELGHETWTTDINSIHNPDYVGDMLQLSTQQIIKERVMEAGIVWMSPVCKGWSLSAGHTHWTEFRQPKTQVALDSMNMMMFARYVADLCVKHNKIFFIENPNGRAVWILDNKYLKRAWYCKYDDKRAKPTNIYTNLDIEFLTCSNGNKDCHHESAPRGSKTGTQGLKNDIERSRIPPKLFYHIFNTLNPNKRNISWRLSL
tara:strand:- start:629 stop:1282 length:654 start_codon:yes stop_codon:yes gene_type:complete